MPQSQLLGRLALAATLALSLAVGMFLLPTYAGPGPDPNLLQTPTPTPTMATAPHITKFVATPDTLSAGQAFLLEWRSVNSTRAQLFTDGLAYEGPVPPTGSIELTSVPAGTYRLRLVVRNEAEPPQSDEATVLVDVAERTDDVIVDDEDAGFLRHGNPDFWWDADIGYGNHMVWTYVNGNAVSNWIEWRPELPRCGYYSVAAFVPHQNATTHEARYEIHFTPRVQARPEDESPRVVVVNQSLYFDEWVPLGTYRVERSEEAHVRLTDATGEDPDSLRQIAFDAIRWRLEKRCASRVFLPLIR